jgi:hypothetical protein
MPYNLSRSIDPQEVPMAMRRFRSTVTLARVAALVAALAAAPGVDAEELVREFSGERSAETAEFEVQAPWLIDWWVNTDFPEGMGIEIGLIDGRRGTHVGRVLEARASGNGVRLIQQGGVYRFKVDSTLARWKIKVVQLTRAEAEQYTPRGQEPARDGF